METLFTDSFRFVHSQDELEKLKEEYPNYDEYYVASGSIQERKEKFDALYQKYRPYADRHFLTEVKKKFHQRTWEMYLGCVLLDRGINFASKDHGPDFLIEHRGKKIWIECIACEKGNNPDSVPDIIPNSVQSVQFDSMLMRISSALREKHKKYKKYLSDGTITSDDQFVIAVNSGELPLSFLDPSLIYRALFARGEPTLSVSSDGIFKEFELSTTPTIKKYNGSKVPMTFFLDKDHEGISAVMYSYNTVLNHPKNIGDDVFIVRNEMATLPLVDGVFDSFKSSK